MTWSLVRAFWFRELMGAFDVRLAQWLLPGQDVRKLPSRRRMRPQAAALCAGQRLFASRLPLQLVAGHQFLAAGWSRASSCGQVTCFRPPSWWRGRHARQSGRHCQSRSARARPGAADRSEGSSGPIREWRPARGAPGPFLARQNTVPGASERTLRSVSPWLVESELSQS